MLPFKLIYSDNYTFPSAHTSSLPKNIAESTTGLLETAVAGAEDFLPPQPASDQDILLVHAPEYVHKLKTGTLSPQEEMQLEVPFSPELVPGHSGWRQADRFCPRARPDRSHRH